MAQNNEEHFAKVVFFGKTTTAQQKAIDLNIDFKFLYMIYCSALKYKFKYIITDT